LDTLKFVDEDADLNLEGKTVNTCPIEEAEVIIIWKDNVYPIEDVKKANDVAVFLDYHGFVQDGDLFKIFKSFDLGYEEVKYEK
jgi:hypothetical protein